MTPATTNNFKSRAKENFNNFYGFQNWECGHKNLSRNSLRKMVESSSFYVFEKLTFAMKFKPFSRRFLCFFKGSSICNESGRCWACYCKAWVRVIRLKNTKKLTKFYWNNYFSIYISCFDFHMFTEYQDQAGTSIFTLQNSNPIEPRGSHSSIG